LRTVLAAVIIDCIPSPQIDLTGVGGMASPHAQALMGDARGIHLFGITFTPTEVNLIENPAGGKGWPQQQRRPHCTARSTGVKASADATRPSEGRRRDRRL